MLSTLKITPQLFSEVYEAILHDWNPNISREQWQTAFTNRWETEEDYFGYALTHSGRIVGIHGMLFSQRQINGRSVRFCNLHAWHVKPDYRAKSLALMKPIIELKDYVVTDFTASPTVTALLKRMGFAALDPAVVVLPSIPWRGSRASARIRELETVDSLAGSPLTAAEQQIYHDHQGIDCGHMLLSDEQDYCYLVFSRVAQHNLPYCLVHYVSNPRLLAEQHAAIRRHVLRSCRSRYMVVEARLLREHHVPLSFRINGRDKLCRSRDVLPHQIDTLYSEIVLLKHSLLPPLRQRLSGPIKRMIPVTLRQYAGIRSEPVTSRQP
jgi:hypothetical protein